MIKVGVISLGCDKNRVDTEIMLSNLTKGGFQLTSEPSQADVIIVNTCAFIEAARKEAIDTIFEMFEFKKKNSKVKIIVTGCLPQKYIDNIYDDFIEVDGFLGTNDYESVVPFINNILETNSRGAIILPTSVLVNEGERILTTPKHYAYIKIADGCDNFCTYCLIPSIRGKYRSRKIESIVEEANQLAQNGVKEIILVAQDTTSYGIDLYNEYKLVDLIKELSKIDKIKWIRLLYCYPEKISDILIEEIKTNDKVLKYLDIPLQHVSNSVLKLMNRKSTKESIVNLFEKLKGSINDLAIRTTFMLGFPRESEDNFLELCEFVKEQKLNNVGFFIFSPEEGTPANKLDGQIDENIKISRLDRLAKIQKGVVEINNKKSIGKIIDVIIDKVAIKDDAYIYFARSYFTAPDIDGVILIKTAKKIDIGEIIKVKIDAFNNYDLIATLI